jgi:hypothetical protein
VSSTSAVGRVRARPDFAERRAGLLCDVPCHGLRVDSWENVVIVSYAAIAIALMGAGAIIAVVVIISLGIHAVERDFRRKLKGVRRIPAHGAMRLLGGAYYIPKTLRPTRRQPSETAEAGRDRTSMPAGNRRAA